MWKKHAILVAAACLLAVACSKQPAPEPPAADSAEIVSESIPQPESPDAPPAEGESPASSPVPQPEPAPPSEASPQEPPLLPPGEQPAPAESLPASAAPPESAPASEMPPAPKSYFIEPGMRHEDVVKMYGSAGQVVMGNPPEDGVVRWQLEGGASVQVRFRAGAVERLTNYARQAQPAPDLSGAQRITKAQYEQIAPGMSLYEVTEYLDIEGRLMATGSSGEKVYRWADEAGGGFSARFVDDKLVRKTALTEVQVEETPVTEEGESDLTEAEVDDGVDEVAEAAMEGEGAWEEETIYMDERPAPPATRTVYSSRPAPAPAGDDAAPEAIRVDSRVRVIGKSSADYNVEEAAPEETYRDRRRRARLPEYKHSLRRGVYEIRVKNDSSARANVGVRQGKQGRDQTIAAGRSASFQLDRGSFEFYYILESDPYSLKQGPTINVDGQVQADMEVRVGDDGASVQSLETPIFY
ncbi:MAG: hypothetical protein RLZZ303_550 [Candidatus Hydrogenedentota bacterium]|jgi:hypothetical protein